MDSDKFYVNAGDPNFKSRQMDVFAALSSFEEKVNLPKDDARNNQKNERSSRSQAKKHRKSTRALRGRESLFKVPGSPPLRPRMPDHRRNPDRWTKYTLADVTSAEMSDASNTAAAMDFLRSRRDVTDDGGGHLVEHQPRIHFNRTGGRRTQRRGEAEEADDDSSAVPSEKCAQKRVAFGEACEPLEDAAASEKAMFVQSKLLMPEYVVGEKQAKAKKTRQPRAVGKQLNLSHLMEQDD